MKAYDADLDSVIEYSIVSGDMDTFQIDGNTGELSLTHTVDREAKETYRLGVRASDGKQFSDINVILVVSIVYTYCMQSKVLRVTKSLLIFHCCKRNDNSNM